MAGADKHVIRACFDHSVQILASLGLAILITALIGAISVGYAVSLMFEHPAIPIGAGAIWFLFLSNFDRQLATATNKRAVYIRLIPALVIGVIVSVPLELRFMEGRIEKQLQEESMAENSHLVEMANQARIEYKTKLERLSEDIQTIETRLSENRRLRSAESSGMENRVAGKGRKWRYYQAEIGKDSLQLLKLESQVVGSTEDYQKDSMYIEQLKAETFLEQSFDFLSRYEALENLKSESPAANALAWALRLFFVMIEVSPALVKLFLPVTEYHTVIEARQVLAKEAIILNANQDMDDLLNDPTNFSTESFWDRVSSFLNRNSGRART